MKKENKTKKHIFDIVYHFFIILMSVIIISINIKITENTYISWSIKIFLILLLFSMVYVRWKTDDDKTQKLRAALFFDNKNNNSFYYRIKKIVNRFHTMLIYFPMVGMFAGTGNGTNIEITINIISWLLFLSISYIQYRSYDDIIKDLIDSANRSPKLDVDNQNSGSSGNTIPD